jgi:hypothetical protein
MSSSTSFGSGVFGSGDLGTAPFFDTEALVTGVLVATGHSDPADETTKRAAILQFLNNTYQEICMGKHWSWMFATYDIPLFGPETTGTISATNNDATITGTGTLFQSTNVKGRLVVNTVNSTYNVLSITSATSLELETKWANDDVTDVNYSIFQVQYQLPNTVDQIRSIVLDELNRKLVPVGPQEFRVIQAQNPQLSGPPEFYTLIRRDVDDDAVYAELYPMPDRDYNLHIDYSVRILRLDDDADCYPIIPDRYRVVLYYGALAQFYRYLKNETSAQLADADFKRTFFRLQNDTQLTDSKLRIKSARNYRNRSMARSLFAGRGFQDRYTFGRYS